MSDIEPDGPKYRLGSKIAKGESRIGTNTLLIQDEDMRWYMVWRHWACATKHQINGLKEWTDDDPSKVPGYDRLSPESQEQLKLALEEGRIVDKDFKGIRPDLAGPAPLSEGCAILDAEGYKVDVSVRPATCRASGCAKKVAKGELRVGFLRSFDGDHSNWVYKHWNCISKHDLDALKACYDQDNLNRLDGIETVPNAFKQAVLHTLRTSEHIAVAKEELPAARPKKIRVKKPNVEDQDNAADETPKAKRSRKKRAAEEVEAASDAEPEYVPKKAKSRSGPKEEPVHHAVSIIEATAAAMRKNATFG